MDHELENIKELLASSDEKNHLLVLELFKRNKKLGKAFALKHRDYIKQLIDNWTDFEVEIAYYMARGEKDLYAWLEKRYLPLIHFLGGKSIVVFRYLPKKVRQFQKTWDVNLKLGDWKAEDSWEEHLEGLKIRRIQYTKKRNVEGLPVSILKLPTLELVTCKKARLNYIPDVWTNMSSVSYLNLRDNHLDSLPQSFGELKSLRMLDLSHNRIKDLSDVFDKLNKLETLNLTSNQLSSLPDSIAKLKGLKALHLSDNNFTEVPPILEKMTNLKSLSLMNNKLTSLPSFLKKMKLENLYLSQNNFKSIPEVIGEMKTLEGLDFRKNEIVGFPDFMGDLDKLKGLFIDFIFEGKEMRIQTFMHKRTQEMVKTFLKEHRIIPHSYFTGN